MLFVALPSFYLNPFPFLRLEFSRPTTRCEANFLVLTSSPVLVIPNLTLDTTPLVSPEAANPFLVLVPTRLTERVLVPYFLAFLPAINGIPPASVTVLVLVTTLSPTNLVLVPLPLVSAPKSARLDIVTFLPNTFFLVLIKSASLVIFLPASSLAPLTFLWNLLLAP